MLPEDAHSQYSLVIDKIIFHVLVQSIYFKYFPTSIKNIIAAMGSVSLTASMVDFENHVWGCDLKCFISSTAPIDVMKRFRSSHL